MHQLLIEQLARDRLARYHAEARVRSRARRAVTYARRVRRAERTARAATRPPAPGSVTPVGRRAGSLARERALTRPWT